MDSKKKKEVDERRVPTRALMIREPHLSNILDGKKTIEIRGTSTKFPKRIALVRSGEKWKNRPFRDKKSVYGEILGVATICDAQPLTTQDYKRLAPQHLAGDQNTKYKTPHGWFLSHVYRLPQPIGFFRRSASVIFAELSVDARLSLANVLDA
jgi:hypothetical protein